jgi:hypothetical protein
VVPLQLIVACFIGWLQREQHAAIEYLREENRILKAQLHRHRLRLTNDERRRLAVLGARLGRRILAQVATILTPDTRRPNTRGDLRDRILRSRRGKDVRDRAAFASRCSVSRGQMMHRSLANIRREAGV